VGLLFQIEEVARGDGQIIPSSRVQVLQNLEGGIIEAFFVKTGSRVEKGDILLRLSGIEAKADLEATRQKYLGTLATVVRLRAEAERQETPEFSEEIMTSVPDTVLAENQAFAANRIQHENQVVILEQQKVQKVQEIAALKRRTEDVAAVIRLTEEERGMIAPLVERGAMSKVELLRLDRSLAQQNIELNGLQLSLPSAEAALHEAEERISEAKSGFYARARQELAEKTIELGAIREKLSAYRDKAERREIKSPMAGIVHDIKVNTIGGVVRAGEPILEVVPLDDILFVEGRIRPADIAFVHEGQRAIIRLSAYDFSVYGALEGKVIGISPDSFTNEREESFYRVQVLTERNAVRKSGIDYDIRPGMQATIDIITGKKTVMQYLLKPFIKASHLALRER
jgi:membrane fusion protein, adhesin transport system